MEPTTPEVDYKALQIRLSGGGTFATFVEKAASPLACPSSIVRELGPSTYSVHNAISHLKQAWV